MNQTLVLWFRTPEEFPSRDANKYRGKKWKIEPE